MHGVFKAIVNGVHTRGSGGVLYVRGDECAYCFPNEFPDQNFRHGIETALSEQGDQAYFVVENRDGKFHVLAYPKDVVARALQEEIAGSAAAPAP